MPTPIPECIENFFARFPLLLLTIKKMNDANIPFAIGGSGCLYLYGNERTPDDVDIFLPDDKHDDVDKLFGIKSFTYKSETENVRNSNPDGNHAVQLTSHLVLNIEGKIYNLSLNENVLQNVTNFEYQGVTVGLLPVEDVLLIKMLLQRDSDVGKHDVEDVQNFLNLQPNIDIKYLESRIDELGARERVGDIKRFF
ncbi:MAG: nucleotidyltransferase [Patescibacteria group bacterium]|nr:nucleotidyltransferase [Patescibacteria group bacterium]